MMEILQNKNNDKEESNKYFEEVLIPAVIKH
jgi:hypothetical protein